MPKYMILLQNLLTGKYFFLTFQGSLRSLLSSSTIALASWMLRQEASFLQRWSLSRTDAGFEQCALHPSSCFSFAAGRNGEQTNLSPVGAASHLAFLKPQPRPNPCDWYACGCSEKPGMPLTPSSQRGPVFARLALRSARIRTNLIWPEGAFLWLMIPPRIFSRSNLARASAAARNASAWSCVCMHDWSEYKLSRNCK